MREIKFRCFSKKYKTMDYCETIKELYDCTHNRKDDSLIKEREIQIMQYTWLNDQNSKEIREWDVLQWSGCSGCCEIRFWTVQVEDNEMYWENTVCWFYKYYFNRPVEYDRIDHMDNLQECKVIGNVYENPELLESKE